MYVYILNIIKNIGIIYFIILSIFLNMIDTIISYFKIKINLCLIIIYLI